MGLVSYIGQVPEGNGDGWKSRSKQMNHTEAREMETADEISVTSTKVIFSLLLIQEVWSNRLTSFYMSEAVNPIGSQPNTFYTLDIFFFSWSQFRP